MHSDAVDDSEEGYKSENNGSNAEDDVDESPSKKTKTNGKAKIKVEAQDDLEEIHAFGNGVSKNPFGGDGNLDMEDGIYA
jgi:hypothetical protein